MAHLGGAGNDWTHDETVLAYALYREFDGSPPASRMRELAKRLGRTEGAVKKKMGNLLSAESGGIAGFRHRSHLDQEVVEEFGYRTAALKRRALVIAAELGAA